MQYIIEVEFTDFSFLMCILRTVLATGLSITNVGLCYLAERATNLEHLSVDDCKDIRSKSMRALAQHCTKLSLLSIR